MAEFDQPGEIGVAIVGYGSASQVFHIPLLRTVPGLALRAIVTSRPEAVRAALPQVRVLPDLSAACADAAIDLVILPTPNATHAALAAQALAAGKHVVVDKPFTLTLAEARGLIELAQARGRVVSVFQNRRWDADDRFHALLRYDRLRVVLHASTLAAAPTPRFELHGMRGGYLKYGLDAQEVALKAGGTPGAPDWGVDPRPGTLTTAAGAAPMPNLAGDYRQYYLALRDAIRGHGPNPVPADEALAVMTVLERGRQSDEARRELPLDQG